MTDAVFDEIAQMVDESDALVVQPGPVHFASGLSPRVVDAYETVSAGPRVSDLILRVAPGSAPMSVASGATMDTWRPPTGHGRRVASQVLWPEPSIAEASIIDRLRPASQRVSNWRELPVHSATSFPFAHVQDNEWRAGVEARLNELQRLPWNWDGYGASRISGRQAVRALTFLLSVMRPDTPGPSIVPVSDGGIQLEWHRAGLDVEVRFADGDDDGVFVGDLRTGETWEGSAEEGFALHDLARRLRGAAVSAT